MFFVDEKSQQFLPIYLSYAGTHFLQDPVERPNGTKYPQILFIEEGEGVFEVGGQKQIIGKNHAVFVHSHCPIRYYAHTDDFTTAFVSFGGKATEDLLTYFDVPPFAVCECASLYPLMYAAFKLYKGMASSEQKSKAIYDILITYFSELHAARRPAAVLKAKQFIEENYLHDIAVAEIAAAAGISSSLLFRLFKQTEQMSPLEMVQSLRIQNAKFLLLSEPSRSVGDVAKSCGFSDTAYFCKIFKSKTGQSPLSFRRTQSL